jgi:hypothetical protein
VPRRGVFATLNPSSQCCPSATLRLDGNVPRSPAPDLRVAGRHAALGVLAVSAAFAIGCAAVKALTAEFPALEIAAFHSFVGFLTMTAGARAPWTEACAVVFEG